MKTLPIASILLTLPALIIAASAAHESFAYVRPLAISEPWRIITNHWVHWSANHLFWSAGMFTLLSIACERIHRTRYLATVAASALAITAALYATQPDPLRYGGLSGIDSALFFLLLGHIAAAALPKRDFSTLAFSALIAVAFLAKIGYELITNTAFFAGTDGDMHPVPLAHLVGAAVGLAALPLASPQAPARGGRSSR